MNLENKVAIVTGATSGIGTGITEALAKAGAKVVFCGRRSEKGVGLKAQYDNKGYNTLFVQADITIEEDIKRLFETTIDHYGKVDILVNNAGILRNFLIKDMDIEKDLNQVMDTNLRAYFVSTKYALNNMSNGGSIVNISSIGGLSGTPNMASYGASKAAVISLTKSTAKEAAAMGIRANAICPGTFISEIMNPEDELTKMSIQMTPMGRAGEMEEIGNLATFLASDLSSYVNGAVITLDGGLSA